MHYETNFRPADGRILEELRVNPADTSIEYLRDFGTGTEKRGGTFLPLVGQEPAAGALVETEGQAK